MSTIAVQELQSDPAAFLKRVEAGEHFVVSRDGRAIAEVRPIASSDGQPRPYGLCAGEFVVPDDFDDPLPEDVLRDFEGR
jgi:antitoxin (DNA-binding transcriptional repressor) of toxin-antitoxin stability system